MSMTLPDLEIIEALDFDYKPGCESAGHGEDRPHDQGAAYALVRIVNGCGHRFDKYYCRTFAEYVTGPRPRTYCTVCDDPWGAGNLISATIISLVN